jgi:hypothetical protein
VVQRSFRVLSWPSKLRLPSKPTAACCIQYPGPR